MKYLFVLAFLLTYIFCDNSLGYSNNSPTYTHFTFILQHVSVFHLVLNSISLIGIWTATRELRVNKWFILLTSLSSTYIASFISKETIPTVGASGMVYAIIGIYFYVTFTDKRIKIADSKTYLLFLLCIVGSLILSYINPISNFFLHTYSLVFGFSIYMAIDCIKSMFKKY